MLFRIAGPQRPPRGSPGSQGSSTACEMLRGSWQRKGRFGPAVGLLAGAFQVVWIPALSPSYDLCRRLGRFGQPPVQLDQYPTGQSDHAGKQREHPSERHQVQEKSHGAFCCPPHSGSVSCPLLRTRRIIAITHSITGRLSPIAEVGSPIKDRARLR